jgi:hypothetical protein
MIAAQISKQSSEADASRSSQNSGRSATTSHLNHRQGAPHSSANRGLKQSQNSLSWHFLLLDIFGLAKAVLLEF